MKLIESDPIIKQAHDAVKEFLKGEDEQASMFGTLIGCAKLLGEFILMNHDLKKLPREIQYYLALTWNSYALIYDPERVLGAEFDDEFQDYFESGSIDDRFAMVVKQMYEMCKDEKLL